jgi:HEPN domain-containing protein
MSAEKGREEAARWLAQARADLDAAGDSARAQRFEWACFQAQQASEKAVKALWYHLSREPWGHSVAKLIQELPDDACRARLADLMDDAKALDRLYIPARYPNGLPDTIPAAAYTARDAAGAIRISQGIVERLAALAVLNPILPA